MFRKVLIVLFAAASLAVAGDGDLLTHVKTVRQSLDQESFENKEEWMVAMKKSSEATYLLTKMLEHDPAGWKVVRAKLQDLPAGDAHKETRGRLLQILMIDKDETSRSLVLRALSKEPDAFNDRMLIALDGQGIELARAALVKKLEGEPGYKKLHAAIHLGLHGHTDARKVLEWGMRHASRGKQVTDTTFMTAVALHRLGAKEPLADLTQKVATTVDAQLKSSRVQTARWMTVQLEYYTKIAKSKEKVCMTGLHKGLTAHYKARSEALDSPADVRKAITALRG